MRDMGWLGRAAAAAFVGAVAWIALASVLLRLEAKMAAAAVIAAGLAPMALWLLAAWAASAREDPRNTLAFGCTTAGLPVLIGRIDEAFLAAAAVAIVTLALRPLGRPARALLDYGRGGPPSGGVR